MATDKAQAIVARQALDRDELAHVSRLRATCNAHDGLDLKLSLVARDDGDVEDQGATQLLAYADGALGGFCSLDVGGEVEVCGMVDPEYRRRGVGRALLAAALKECRRRDRSRVLLICEDASAAGKAFVAAVGATRQFAEHRMELTSTPGPWLSADAGSVALRQAGPEDLDTIARVQAAVFGDPEEAVRRFVRQDLGAPGYRFYLGFVGDVPVSSLKLIFIDGKAAIYAFGVLPQYRRQGLGRQVLLRLFESLRAEGWTRLSLEVETDNDGALALYQSLGFRVTTTYGYYALAL